MEVLTSAPSPLQALLYNNQEAVGTAIKEAIAAGDCSREDLWVTSKVAFYPGEADGASHWVPGKFHPGMILQ